MLNKLHTIDVIVIISYLLLCLIIGFVSSKKVHNIKDYALGNRSFSTLVLIGTFLATDIGAGLTVGVVSNVYASGLIFATAILVRPFTWLIARWVVGRNIEEFQHAGCISTSDIIQYLYGVKGRWVVNILTFIISIITLTVQLVVMSNLFKYFLDIEPMTCAFITFLVIATYSLFGGIRAVAFTDVMQSFIFFIGIPFTCILALDDLGMHYSDIISQLPSTHTSIDLKGVNLWLLLSMVFCILTEDLMHAPNIQRYLMAQNGRQLRTALTNCFFISVPFSAVLIIIGLIMKLKAPHIDPDTTLFYLVDTYLPVGIKGLLVVGLLAVIMSTTDSWLNTGSILCAHDIVGKLFPKFARKRELLIARIFIIILAGIASYFAFFNPHIMLEYYWLTGIFISPIFLIPLIAGFLKLRTSSKTFFFSIFTAILGVLYGRYVSGEYSTIATMLGVIGNVIGFTAAHLYQAGGLKASTQLHIMKHKQHISILKLIAIRLEHIVEENGNNYRIAGGIGLAFILGALFFNEPGTRTSTLIQIQMLSTMLALPLFMYEYFFLSKLKKFLPIYYFMTLCVIISLNSGYMLIMYSGQLFWFFNFILAALILHFLIGLIASTVLVVIGIVLAWALYTFIGHNNAPHEIISNVYFIIFNFALVLIAARFKHALYKRGISAREYTTKMVAHQVMQPISQTSMTAHHIENILSKYSSQNGTVTISEGDFVEIKRVMEDFSRASISNTKTVRGLLHLMRTDMVSIGDVGEYNVKECLQEALSLYNREELARIFIKRSSNFKVNISKILFVEVIRNIITNSLRYAGKHAQIEITYRNYTLIIKDNGIGINREKLQNIFSGYESEGFGLGLVLCKNVMDSFGYLIECDSVPNKYTKFTLQFV